jgi:hypothetical protein
MRDILRVQTDDLSLNLIQGHWIVGGQHLVYLSGHRRGKTLAEKTCPATKEEELLKEMMWSVATPDERKTIATLIFKMVQ